MKFLENLRTLLEIPGKLLENIRKLLEIIGKILEIPRKFCKQKGNSQENQRFPKILGFEESHRNWEILRIP